ncbi:MAG: hypothetical protein K5986_09010 [Clostridium sp.]|nr:hypothetical protein [Clostridium sp.]
MKKILKLVTMVMAFSVAIVGFKISGEKAYAYETNDILVDVNFESENDGNFKAGDDVIIKLKLNNTQNLYAASFKYTYDPNILQVDSIEASKDISSASIYEPYNETNKNGNIARYCFTFLGDEKGLNGNHDFVTIKGKSKTDGKININTDNIKFELVRRDRDNMVKDNFYIDDGDDNVYKVTEVKDSSGKETGESKAELVQTAADNKKEKVNLEEEANLENVTSPEAQETSKDNSSNEASESKDEEPSSKDKEPADENSSDEDKEDVPISKDSNKALILLAIIAVAGGIILLSKLAEKKLKSQG